MMYYYQKQQAFSLVETLVAISILLIVIVGPMTITARTAKSSTFATEQAQAFFLAQEGIELAQKLRDDRMLLFFHNQTNNTWSTFRGGTAYPNLGNCYDSNGCGLHWTGSADIGILASNCGGANNLNTCRLYQKNSGRNYFTHTSTNANITPFVRKIYFTRDGTNDTYVRVRSEVVWRTGSIISLQRVELETYLYNVYGLN